MTEQAGPDRNGPALLDIGRGRGALLLLCPAELMRREIEVSPVGADQQRVHTEVLRRVWGGLTAHTAVFAELSPGEYTVWGINGTPRSRVTVQEGVVTQVDWR